MDNDFPEEIPDSFPEWGLKPADTLTYDDAFWIRKQPFGTFVSVQKNGTELITSLTEELCVEATRFYLKFKQDSACQLS
jgi:hypothetical protein